MAGLLSPTALANEAILKGADPLDVQSLLGIAYNAPDMTPSYVETQYVNQPVPVGADLQMDFGAPELASATDPDSYEARKQRYEARKAAGTLNQLPDVPNPYQGSFLEDPMGFFQEMMNMPQAPGPSTIQGQPNEVAMDPKIEGQRALAYGKQAYDNLNAALPDVSFIKPSKDNTPKELYDITQQNQTKAELASAGATKEDLNAWDKLNQEFDMNTVAMALLASNDGSSNLSANIGKAFMMGRQAKINKAAAQQKAKLDQGELAVKQANAWTDRLKAVAAGAGMEWKGSDKDSREAARLAFDRLGIDINEFAGKTGALDVDAILHTVGAPLKAQIDSTPNMTEQQRQRYAEQAVKNFMLDFENTALFGQDWEYK